MQLLQSLWTDEAGLVLSAEAVTVGTVGVLGAVVGLSAANDAVDAELKEFGMAIRSLDQSYAYQGHASCRAWSAGSYFVQKPVQEAVAELCGVTEADPAVIREKIDASRQTLEPSKVETVPNKIPPKKTKKPDDNKKPSKKKGKDSDE